MIKRPIKIETQLDEINSKMYTPPPEKESYYINIGRFT